MTSKELVSATLQGRPIPRFPIGPLAVHFCAGIAGYTLQEYSTNATALADSIIRYYERFRPDAVWLSADTWVSAQAMGATLAATDPDQPLSGIGEPTVKTVADIDRIPSPDVSSQGRYPVMIEALAKVVQALGRDVFIVACFDQYPFSLASALMGINEIMLRIHDDPAFVEALMVRCEEQARAYAQMLAQTGADMLSGGDSPAGLLGPRAYSTMALPAQRRLIASLQRATGKPVSLHICGNARPILPLMASSGADVLEFDHLVDVATASALVKSTTALWGNLDPVGVLAHGTSAAVAQTAQSLLDTIRATGHTRFVLSSGCTLAPRTPAVNLLALLHTDTRLKRSTERRFPS